MSEPRLRAEGAWPVLAVPPLDQVGVCSQHNRQLLAITIPSLGKSARRAAHPGTPGDAARCPTHYHRRGRRTVPKREPATSGFSPAISRSCFIPASGSRTSPCAGLAQTARRDAAQPGRRQRHGQAGAPARAGGTSTVAAHAVRSLDAWRCPTRSGPSRTKRPSPPCPSERRPITSSWNFEPMLPVFWRGGDARRRSARRCWASASPRRGGRWSGAGAVINTKCR